MGRLTGTSTQYAFLTSRTFTTSYGYGSHGNPGTTYPVPRPLFAPPPLWKSIETRRPFSTSKRQWRR